MKKQTKLLVLLLSVALVLAGLVIAVSADTSEAKIGSTSYPTLAEAVNAAKEVTDGSTTTITLTSDVTLGAALAFGEVNVVLDLNGHSLTSTAAHAIEINKTNLSVVGSGTITVDGALIYDLCSTASTGKTVNIGSDDKVIKLIHNATVVSQSYKDSSNKTVNNYFAIRTNSGTWNIKNLDMTTKYTSSQAICIEGGTTVVNFEDCKIYANTKANGEHALVIIKKSVDVNFDGCRIETTGQAALTVNNNLTGTVNYNNTFVNVPFSNGNSTFLYSNYGTLGGDIIVTDSYISFNAGTNMKLNTNNSALILRNSVFELNGSGGRFARSMNIKLEAGSALIGTSHHKYMDIALFAAGNHDNVITSGKNYTPIKIEGRDDLTGVNMLISEGACFDSLTYNKIVNRRGPTSSGGTVTYYAENQVVYPDGSTPQNSTTYKIVYDPSVNPKAPYVVVKYDADYPKVPDYSHDTFTHNTIWNGNGSYGVKIDSEFNKYWAFNYNNTNNKAADFIFGSANGAVSASNGNISGGISEARYNVLVYDIDIAADALNGFTRFQFGLHSRKYNSSGKDSGTNVPLFTVVRDGTLTLVGDVKGGDASTMKLSLGEWHHVTMVVDTTPEKGILYLYVDGVYLGSRNAYTEEPDANTDIMINGPRLSVSTNASGYDNTNILLDNIQTRAYGSLESTEATYLITKTAPTYGKTTDENGVITTVLGYNNTAKTEYYVSTFTVDTKKTPTAIEDNGVSYLLNGGKANNTTGVASGAITTHTNFNVADIDAALALAANGTVVTLNKDINLPQTVTKEGTIVANGHKLLKTAESNAFDTIYDGEVISHYVVNEAYNNETVEYKWYIGDIDSEKQKLDESKWINVTYNPGDIIEYTGAKLADHLVEKGYDYKFAPHNGWTVPVGTLNSHVTLANAKGNDVVEVYPTYDVSKAAVNNNYKWVVLDEEGCFSRGGSANNLYGSAWEASKTGAISLVSGETFVFLYNLNIYGTISPDDHGNDVFNIDFNGRDVTFNPTKQTSGFAAAFIIVNANQTYNVFSSQPGATLTIHSYQSDSKKILTGGTAFEIQTSADELTETLGNTDNAKVNVSDITVNCDVLFNGARGDRSCEFNAENITVVRTSNKVIAHLANSGTPTESLIVSTVFSGEFNLKNSNIIMLAEGSLISSVRWMCLNDENGDKLVSENELVTKATATFDGCTIIKNKNTASGSAVQLHNDTLFGFESVKITNTLSNARFNGSSNGKGHIYIGEGVVYIDKGAIHLGDCTGANYNMPMILAGITDADTFTAKYIVEETVTETVDGVETTKTVYNWKTFVIASNGYVAAEGETVDLTLPILTNKLVKNEDVIDVTYTNAETGKVTTDKYAEGGIFTLETPEAGYVYDGGLMDATFLGTWTVNGVSGKTETVYTVTEALTFVPDYTNVTYTFAKPQVNLSLAADFSINLYVSVDYKNYVDSIVESGVALKATEVDINEDGVADYIMVTIAKKATEATDNAVFTINLKDGPLTVTETATISIAAYAEKILDGAYDADDKALMYYILNYTKEAETYFDKAADAEALANIAKKYTGKTVAIDHNYVALDTSAFKGTIAEATVVLEDVPKFKFTLASGFTGNVTITDGKNERGSFDITADGSKEIVIDTIKAYNFDKTLKIMVTPTAAEGEEAVTTTYEYNLATFAAYHTAQAAKGNADSEAALNVIGALYDYAKVAYMYKTGTLAAAVTE